MITRRRVLLAVLALFLAGVGVIAWTLAGLPPVKYYLRYGLDPYCEPTGATVTLDDVQFVEIGPGIFRMGSTHMAEGGDWLGKLCKPFGMPWGKHPKPSAEMPVHWVEFRRGFWIATTEVTNLSFERFRNHWRRNSSSSNDTPVVHVSREEARDYCAWLGEKSGYPVRLPSEAEWECACRAGSDREFTSGDDEESLSESAWHHGNSGGRAHPVGAKSANRWGLSDLHGNVGEWCEDTYCRTYVDAPSDGSARREAGQERDPYGPRGILRGGSFLHAAESCRCSVRDAHAAGFRSDDVGFRPAFSNPDD